VIPSSARHCFFKGTGESHSQFCLGPGWALGDVTAGSPTGEPESDRRGCQCLCRRPGPQGASGSVTVGQPPPGPGRHGGQLAWPWTRQTLDSILDDEKGASTPNSTGTGPRVRADSKSIHHHCARLQARTLSPSDDAEVTSSPSLLFRGTTSTSGCCSGLVLFSTRNLSAGQKQPALTHSETMVGPFARLSSRV